MPAITRDSLLTLEAYARERASFRARVLAHKRNRSVALGDHVTLLFEDELTIRYQIQEMLRIERTFEEAGIQDELEPAEGVDVIDRELTRVYAEQKHPERWKIVRYDVAHQETPEGRIEALAFLRTFL